MTIQQQQQDKGKGREIVQDGSALTAADAAAAPARSEPVVQEQPSPTRSSAEGQRKTTFISLPVEVIERIIAKCEENDIELLESETTEMIKQIHEGASGDGAASGAPSGKAENGSAAPTGASAGDADNGWETESDGEDIGSEDSIDDDEDDSYARRLLEEERVQRNHAWGIYGREGSGKAGKASQDDAGLESGIVLTSSSRRERIVELERCPDCGDYHDDPGNGPSGGDNDDSGSESDAARRRRRMADLPPPPVLAVHQLAMTSKALRVLALPFVFRAVDFEALPNHKVRLYIDTLAPKYGHLVQELWFRISLNENQEFISISWSEGDDPDAFQPQRRYELALELLHALPNLSKIDIDLPTTTAFLPPPTELIIDCIAERGEQLTRLCLTGDPFDQRLFTSNVAPLLLQLPNLELLELSGVDTQSSHGPSLLRTIADMEHLKYLDLDDALCVNDEWAAAPWKCGLRGLALDDCQNMTDVGVQNLLMLHGQTLRSITLDMVPYEGAAALNHGPPFDFPLLQELSTESSDITIDFLERFARCPELYRLQLGSMEEISVTELSRLIESSRSGDADSTKGTEEGGEQVASIARAFPSLREVSLSADWAYDDGPGSAAWDSLELLCFQHGITLSVEEDDEEDDEEDSLMDDTDYDDEGLDVEDPWDDEDEEEDDDQEVDWPEADAESSDATP